MDKQVHFRIEGADYTRLVEAAKDMGLNTSGLIRRILRAWLRAREDERRDRRRREGGITVD
jgi:hypothetical protein